MMGRDCQASYPGHEQVLLEGYTSVYLINMVLHTNKNISFPKKVIHMKKNKSPIPLRDSLKGKNLLLLEKPYTERVMSSTKANMKP